MSNRSSPTAVDIKMSHSRRGIFYKSSLCLCSQPEFVLPSSTTSLFPISLFRQYRIFHVSLCLFILYCVYSTSTCAGARKKAFSTPVNTTVEVCIARLPEESCKTPHLVKIRYDCYSGRVRTRLSYRPSIAVGERKSLCLLSSP
jgi:hypothetical protein